MVYENKLLHFIFLFSFLCSCFRAIQTERSKSTVETLFNTYSQRFKNDVNSAKIESKNDGGTATNGRSWFC